MGLLSDILGAVFFSWDTKTHNGRRKEYPQKNYKNKAGDHVFYDPERRASGHAGPNYKRGSRKQR